jgi:transcriptional antiterminator
MKSMKEIADELNVTKMTVYNNAKKANVKFQKIDSFIVSSFTRLSLLGSASSFFSPSKSSFLF